MIFGMVIANGVRHIARTEAGPFGLTVSPCGRVITPGTSDARLCKTCVRLTGYVEHAALTDAQQMIQNCKSDHVHMDTEAFMANRFSGTQLGMFRDVLADFQSGMDNDLCWIGTIMLILDRPNLIADGPKASETTRKGGSNPNAGTIDPKNAKPARKRGCGASEKQEKLIRDLISQIRELNSEAADILDTIYTEQWMNDVKWANISPAIDALFAAKNDATKKAREKSAQEAKTDPAEDGYYMLGDTFVCVKWNRARTGQYATVWDGSSWEYDNKASRQIVADVKAGKLAHMTPEDAKRFGDLYGQCFKCSRTLTDPESIAMGYGPVCAGKMGW